MRQPGKLLFGVNVAAPAEQGEQPRSAPTRLELFLSFLRLGVTAFGGPAMIAYINDLVVKRKKWLDLPAFKAGVALAQAIPGASMMQTVAYVGLQARGITGALVSYAGFALPAFCLMLGFSALYGLSRNLPWVTSLFSGLQVMVVAMVAHATYTFGRTSLKHTPHVLLAALSAAALGLRVSPFYVVLGAALLGMLSLRDKPEVPAAKDRGKAYPVTPLFALPAGLALALLVLHLFRPDLMGLALLMLKVDLFAFGGGFASVPLMLQQVVQEKGWMDATAFMDGIALGQVTPGPIVITATFVGYLTHGLAGAVVATTAIFAPSFILVVLTAPFFNGLQGSTLFTRATQGVLASFVGLLLYVTFKFAMTVPWDLLRLLLLLGCLAALVRKIDLIYLVPAGAALSLLLF